VNVSKPRAVVRGLAAIAVAAATVTLAGATTLRRVGLDDLTTTNGTIVVGKVLETHSYWNPGRTSILTDARIATSEVLKGPAAEHLEITVTLLGGSVDDRALLIVGGAQLLPGRSYVLFLNEGTLPGGVEARYTLLDHSQGAFDIVAARDGSGLRAVSQAQGHPLVPDARGLVVAPGGRDGVPLQDLKQAVRSAAGRKGDGR
jgi:hypothetical protein